MYRVNFYYSRTTPRGATSSQLQAAFLGQVPLLSERLHPRVHLRLLAVAAMGAAPRLDGPERDQPPSGVRRTRSRLEQGLQIGKSGKYSKRFQLL